MASALSLLHVGYFRKSCESTHDVWSGHMTQEKGLQYRFLINQCNN